METYMKDLWDREIEEMIEALIEGGETDIEDHEGHMVHIKVIKVDPHRISKDLSQESV